MMAARQPPLWRAFRRLDRDDRRLVVEAGALLAVVWLGLRILPFASLRRSLEGGSERLGAGVGTPVARIGWAVAAAGRRFPPGRNCLVEALATDFMLRRRGYQSELRFGVRKDTVSSPPIDAHVWVESDGRVVAGDLDNLAEY